MAFHYRFRIFKFQMDYAEYAGTFENSSAPKRIDPF